MPPRSSPDPDLPVVCTVAEAYAAGLTRDQVRQRVRSGRWRSLAFGVYERTVDVADDPGDRFACERGEHVRRATAGALAFRGSAIAVHSAVVAHGLPLASALPEDVALNVPMGDWNGRRIKAVLHRMTLLDGDLDIGRVPVTSVARTCADVARLMHPADGLAVADAALRAGRIDREDLAFALARSIDRRGMAQASMVLAHADPRRESPGESASWAYFLRHGVPLPRMQVDVRSAGGRFIARVDFLWAEARLVGEFDGRLKYVAGSDLYAEKRREDALRGEQYGVLRWGAVDLSTPDLARRIVDSIRQRQ